MNRVVVNLMGGLGNQMFQYAAGRSLAVSRDAELILDTKSGFARDHTFGRSFELEGFPIAARQASFSERLPFWVERVASKLHAGPGGGVTRRPWGTLISEDPAFVSPAVASSGAVFLRGYWQTEACFSSHREIIGRELSPKASRKAAFVRMAREIEDCTSVAVGIRLFEEVPGADKAGVGGLVPLGAYSMAANELAKKISNPHFYVFCTTRAVELNDLPLPGPVTFITNDNGFEGTLDRLWLLSRCKQFIISNSSFYWWGAWLAEFERPETRVMAIDQFPNVRTIPLRWTRLRTQ